MGIPALPCEHKNVYSTFHGPTEVHVTVCTGCFVVIHLCSGTAPEIPPKLLAPPHGDCTAYFSALQELHYLACEWVKDPVHALPALMDQIETADSAKELMESMRLPHGASNAPPGAPRYDQHGFLPMDLGQTKATQKPPLKGSSAPAPEGGNL